MSSPAIRYRVSMPQPATHLLMVEMQVDGAGNNIELRLPVWTPGSYMVREFARHVQGFQAKGADGRPLAWKKTRKDTWLVDSTGADRIIVGFEVYANDLTVRTSHLDGTHAFFNAANLLPYVEGRTREPLRLYVDAPDGWTVETGLRRDESPGEAFIAVDYDELVDSPVHAGPDPVLEFEACGVPHRIATWGRSNLDADRLVADTKRIVETQAELFGGLPYESYVFILMTTDGARGGLEHRNSSALMLPRFNFRPGRTYERALQLISHEFFHTWNVKRIHPIWSDRAFDYSTENYTRLLWAMEGITDYYTSLMLRRAGLITPERYVEILADQMRDLQETPGRNVQSLEESSFDAWIKYYRPDEHSSNSSISYYLKGSLVTLLLDLEMRGRTQGKRSLDDLMRLLWLRYGQPDQGVPEDAYERLVEVLTGTKWTEFFDRYVRGREELDYRSALRAVGIELDEQADSSVPDVWLGMRTRSEGGRIRVTSIASDGPAWGLDLSAGDELLALDGVRLDEASLSDRLRDYHPGDTVWVTGFHGDQLIEVAIILAARPPRIALRKSKNPTVQQRSLYESWMGAPWE